MPVKENPKKILLLSAYDAVSHQQWRRGIVENFPEHDWTVLTLPARHFSWRVRGNSLSWACSEGETLEQQFDLIIATSMTDLSALKGMIPSLAATPSLLYFHENQFDYPTNAQQFQSVESRITSIYAALASDRIVFNSSYNRDTFMSGVTSLLKKMPDHVPDGIVELLKQRSICLPVPLDDAWGAIEHQPDRNRFTILWNHRWEYDKAPERLFKALVSLKERHVDFRLHLLGQRFRKTPSVFEEMRETLSQQIGAWGYIEDMEAYRETIRQSHVVISTALHDFQGLAILEATAAGCIPCVPDRLAYPEFIPDNYRYNSCPDDEVREAESLAASLSQLAESHRRDRLPTSPDVSYLFWANMRDRYREVIEALL